MHNDTSKVLYHKMLFFFMPDKVTFFKNDFDNLENLTEEQHQEEFLKKISPYFYWCSAHEFLETEMNEKFLLQYQIYYLEDGKAVPGEIVQTWHKNKNTIKLNVIDFIEMWSNHKRLIINPKETSNENKAFNDIVDISIDQSGDFKDFSNFAKFVAKSILTLQDFYIKESEQKKFDLLQKRFWENLALNYKNIILEQKLKTKKKITKKSKNNRRNSNGS